MAHIGVEVRNDPWGEAVARLESPGADASRILPPFDDIAFPLLRLVDPYGTTYFNSYQMTGVLEELRRLPDNGPEGSVLPQLIALAEVCQRTIHSYLTFLGD